MTDHTPVESYASVGLRLWARGAYPHGPSICRCLCCSDARRHIDEPRVPSVRALFGAPMAQDGQREGRVS